jgi:hypothetical protein
MTAVAERTTSSSAATPEADRRFTNASPAQLTTVLAVVGGVFVAAAIAIWVAWLASPTHSKPVDPGPSRLPWATHAWVVGFEWASCTLAIGAVILVVRKCLQQNRLAFDALLVFAWLTCYIQDPFINWVRPAFTYNAYLANHGSWSSEVPGWISPLGSRLPECYLFIGVAYFWMAPLAAVITSKVMQHAARRDPNRSVLGLFLRGYLAMVVLDLAFEVPFVHTGVYAYPGAIHWLSLWPGKTYQFPVYESLIWAFVWAGMGALRYSALRREDDLSLVERGSTAIRRQQLRPVTRILAVVAVAQLLELTIYCIPMWGLTHYGGPWPKNLPSYLSDGLCGPPTPYACQTPHSPIYVR